MSSKDFRESISIETISITGAIAAGFILASGLKLIDSIPSLLILIPGFLGIHGSISTSIASRIAAGLFLGAIKPTFKPQRILVGNAVAGVILSLSLSLFLGIAAYSLEFLLSGKSSPQVIMISLMASVISSPIMITTTIIFSIWFFRKHFDPNNIMGPYMTTLGDIIGIIVLILIAIGVVHP